MCILLGYIFVHVQSISVYGSYIYGYIRADKKRAHYIVRL